MQSRNRLKLHIARILHPAGRIGKRIAKRRKMGTQVRPIGSAFNSRSEITTAVAEIVRLLANAATGVGMH